MVRKNQPKKIPTLKEWSPEDVLRFIQKFEKRNQCWEWQGGPINRISPYGRFNWKGGQALAHRVSYSMFIGKLDTNLVLDHLCLNKKCVNPKHLQQVTIYENTMRSHGLPSLNKKKTHCKRGHEFIIENTGHRKNGKERFCRTCTRKPYRK